MRPAATNAQHFTCYRISRLSFPYRFIFLLCTSHCEIAAASPRRPGSSHRVSDFLPPPIPLKIATSTTFPARVEYFFFSCRTSIIAMRRFAISEKLEIQPTLHRVYPRIIHRRLMKSLYPSLPPPPRANTHPCVKNRYYTT